MAISRKTSDEFATDLEESVLSRNANYDTKVGPIPDLVIRPLSNVLELQNERIRSVQQLLSLINDGSFTDADLDSFVYNEMMLRLNGSRATVTLIFSRVTAPTTDITVRANFPVATLSDETTGVSTTFLTLVDTTMVAANAAAYFNSATQRYELQVTAQSVGSAEVGNVAPNRIIRPLRPLSGFDTVFNRDIAIGGRDAETNDELIQRYYLSLRGTSPAVVAGIHKIIRDKFPAVSDSNAVFGNNPLNVRAATDGGAVDVYVIGSTPVTVTENVVFTGAEQVLPLVNQPVTSISSVIGYVQGTDFVLDNDSGGNVGSVRAVDGVRFLGTGSIPAIGTVLVVTYTYNGLLTQLQDGFTTDDRFSPGRDLLFKEATQVSVTLSANIKVRPGFNIATVTDAVSQVILALINNGELSDDVEGSDLQAVVRAFSSIDNFVITNLAKVGQTGTSDIAIGDNEYARLDTADLILTVV